MPTTPRTRRRKRHPVTIQDVTRDWFGEDLSLETRIQVIPSKIQLTDDHLRVLPVDLGSDDPYGPCTLCHAADPLHYACHCRFTPRTPPGCGYRDIVTTWQDRKAARVMGSEPSQFGGNLCTPCLSMLTRIMTRAGFAVGIQYCQSILRLQGEDI